MRAKGKNPVHTPTEPDAIFEERMADGGDVDEMPDADEGAATEHEEDVRAEFEAARACMKAAIAALPSEDDEDGAFTDHEKEGEMVVDKAEEAVQEETGEEAQDEDEEGGATAVTAEEEDYATPSPSKSSAAAAQLTARLFMELLGRWVLYLLKQSVNSLFK